MEEEEFKEEENEPLRSPTFMGIQRRDTPGNETGTFPTLKRRPTRVSNEVEL